VLELLGGVLLGGVLLEGAAGVLAAMAAASWSSFAFRLATIVASAAGSVPAACIWAASPWMSVSAEPTTLVLRVTSAVRLSSCAMWVVTPFSLASILASAASMRACEAPKSRVENSQAICLLSLTE